MLPIDPLQPVPSTRLKELSEKLLADVPQSLTVHGIVQTALEWQETDFSQRIGLYSTNEDFESSAIVGIFTVSESNDYSVSMYCFGEDTSELREALMTTSRINWGSPETTIVFTAIPERLLSVLEQCLSHHDFRIVQTEKSLYNWKTPDQLKTCKYSCPPDVKLAPLGLESAELVRKYWHNLPGAAEYIETLIKHNVTLGVYSCSTGELCAWVLCNQFYAFTMMHTMEGHRRKGYAQLLCNALSERLLRSGIIVRAVTMAYNKPSLSLFKAHQFKSSQNLFVYTLAMPLRTENCQQYEL